MTQTLASLHQKIDRLPEDALYALAEYVDFLAHKHQAEPGPDEEYDALLKELLLKRYEKMKAAPEKRIGSEDFWQKVRRKRGWNV